MPSGEPVWFVMIVALSGLFASLGESLVRRIQLALDELGTQVAGRELPVLVEIRPTVLTKRWPKLGSLSSETRAHLDRRDAE